MADETQKTEELIKCVSELDIDEETKCSVIDLSEKDRRQREYGCLDNIVGKY